MNEVHSYSTAVGSSNGWSRIEARSEQVREAQNDEATANKPERESGFADSGAEKPDPRLMAPFGELEPLEAYRADDPQALAKAIERVENFISRVGRDLQFSVDDQTGKTVVTVYVQGTDDVVRQIPPEEMLAIAARMKEVQGLLFNERA